MTPNPMDQLALAADGPLAALILVIGGGIFLAIAARQRWHRATDPTAATRPPSIRRSLAVIMAGLSAGAAIIHLAAAPAHFGEIGDLASGFVVAAIFQAIWIRWCLAGPSRGTALVGIAGNLAIVAAWAWTRTVGLPFGELAGTPEPAGYPDVASVVFELLLIAGLVGRLRNVDIAASRRRGVRLAASIALVPVLGLVLVLTSLATVAIASGMEHDAPTGHAMAGMDHSPSAP
ncbi:MAG: hypothetical protein ABIZ72_06230 [Candidatus Limnocylindrales bacterium]